MFKDSLLLFGTLFILQAATQNITDLPECGRICLTNMKKLAPSLGCQVDDKKCICTNKNYGAGIQDCINESCPSGTNLTLFRKYSKDWCGDEVSEESASATSSVKLSIPNPTGTGSPTIAQGQSTTAISTGLSTASSDANTANNDHDDDKLGVSSGLSNGGKIGFAVGLAVLGFVVIASVLLFCRNREQKRKDAEQGNMPAINVSSVLADESNLKAYRGTPTPNTPSWATRPWSMQTTSPVSPRQYAPRAPLSHRLSRTSRAFAELQGGTGPLAELHPLHRPVHELPSPQ